MVTKQKITSITPKRGEVYLVNFDPTIGFEISKTRPALIIQNDVGNVHSGVTIVAAINSARAGTKVYPTEVAIEVGSSGLDTTSLVLLNQIRTIDKSRLVKRLGRLSKDDMAHVTTAIQISLDTIGI